MKTQMKFQKIFMLVSLIIAALTVVFSLIFCSGGIFQISKLYDSSAGVERIAEIEIPGESIWDEPEKFVYTAHGAKDFFNVTQNVSDVLLIMGIVMVLAVVLNYVMGTNKRRKYYITNYVAVGIAVAFEIALAIVIIVMVHNCQTVFSTKCDLDSMKAVYEYLYKDAWKPNNNWTFPLGYALAGILLVNAVGFVLNLIWKIKLMQGEKKLLESGLVKEVA